MDASGCAVGHQLLEPNTGPETGTALSLTSYDNATVGSGSIVNEVHLAYNDFAQLTTEYQEHAGAVNTSTSLRVQYSYADGSSSSNQIRAATLVYPNGRTISHDYGTSSGMDDVLNRVENLKEGSTTYASYSYLGGGTIVRIDYPTPQVRLDLWGGTSGSFAGLVSPSAQKRRNSRERGVGQGTVKRDV